MPAARVAVRVPIGVAVFAVLAASAVFAVLAASAVLAAFPTIAVSVAASAVSAVSAAFARASASRPVIQTVAPCSRAAARMMLSAMGSECRKLKAAASRARCTVSSMMRPRCMAATPWIAASSPASRSRTLNTS